MPFTPKDFQEWHFNEILYALFAIKDKNKYMLVFQEHDLGNYLDVGRYRTSKDPKKRQEATATITHITRNIENFCQSFRPDAILIRKDGTPYVLEVKLKQRSTSTIAGCNELVLQSMIYSNILLSPAYYHRDKKNPIPPYDNTRNFLNHLGTAHWFSRSYDEKILDNKKVDTIEEKARFIFQKNNFQIKDNTCGVIFAVSNPKQELLPMLIRACQVARSKSFEEYCGKVTFNKNCRFVKRVGELKHNWQKLQSISFHFLPINLDALQQTLGEPLDLLE